MQILLNIDVPELAPAIAFYTDGLGLTLTRTLGGRVAELAGAGTPVYLLEKPAGSRPAPSASARDYTRHWTPVHADFVVPDVDAAVARAVAAGAVLEHGPESHAWGRIAHLADPFGNGLCLLRLSEAGYAAVADPA
ncbi:VOC family protein [Pseudomonadota bacterium AL_CKDN230030165-1A_HGKHYDSX7]